MTLLWVHLVFENEMFDILRDIGLIYTDKQNDCVNSFPTLI